LIKVNVEAEMQKVESLN